MKKRVLGILAALFVFAVLLPVGVGAAGTRYGDWSDWSDSTPPSPPSGRGIETDTRSITVVDGHMEYRYGRWVGATINWCKEYGEALHGGTYSIEETAWSATRATDTDTHWLCGHFDWEHPSHVHVSGYDYRGYPMWTRYLVDGYSNPEFYWEETRWVDAVYQTQYRWRYIYYDYNVRDAYSFGNSMRDFGYTSRGPGMGQYPIPSRPFFMIFGESVRTRLLYMREASKAWTGNCAGMASSAALLFAYGQLNPADFGKSNTYSLAIGDRNAEEMPVLTLIEAMQIAQYTDAFGRARQANQIPRGQSLDGLYQTIRDEIAQGRPTLLAIVKEHVGGHALLAVGADGENSILIYDCNHPGELRYMTLSADKTAWRYDMGSYGLWGTDSGGCSISYVPYAVLEDIWANRGHLQPSSQVLTVNAENVSITNFDGETVASLENGQLVTSADGVYELFDLSMYWPEERSICLPRNEVYTVSTSDDITLSARMTDQHMSAEITTSANTVIFGVSDDERENSVIVQGAAASDTYSITLESDFDDLCHKNVTLTGTGQGESVQVSMNQDGVTFVNCNIESLSLDVCEIVSAARDRDGKLSVTLTNPNRVTLAVSYFDAREKFVSAALQDVAADAGAVSVDIPAGAASARVALFDTDCRPLCTAFEADFTGGAG
ncbi:MAG: hypothetical protein IJR48_06790 [Oscillibacter sp.]|nr:hypothetical protein [Oscillibacter sp.]